MRKLDDQKISIIAGDWNARNTKWDPTCRSSNVRGRQLDEALGMTWRCENSLNRMTTRLLRGKSSPDLVITRRGDVTTQALSRWVLPGSDHCVIGAVCRPQQAFTRTFQGGRTNIDWRSIDWEEVRGKVRRYIESVKPQGGTSENLVYGLMEAAMVGSQTFCKRRGTFGKRDQEWERSVEAVQGLTDEELERWSEEQKIRLTEQLLEEQMSRSEVEWKSFRKTKYPPGHVGDLEGGKRQTGRKQTH